MDVVRCLVDHPEPNLKPPIVQPMQRLPHLKAMARQTSLWSKVKSLGVWRVFLYNMALLGVIVIIAAIMRVIASHGFTNSPSSAYYRSGTQFFDILITPTSPSIMARRSTQDTDKDRQRAPVPDNDESRVVFPDSMLKRAVAAFSGHFYQVNNGVFSFLVRFFVIVVLPPPIYF